MTEFDFLYDTWAWWEYLRETAIGASVRERCFQGRSARVHTSTLTIAEISALLQSANARDRAETACGAIWRMSHIWDVTADIAQ